MGVPKFFRWMAERYPKINQRAGFPPDHETYQRHYGKLPPEPVEQPDPLSTCGLPPPIDRLYIDMNGIIHGCSHNNSDPEDTEEDSNNPEITMDDIFRNVCYYLDRIVADIAKPTELVYMAIDGVAPRAKLNQQRSRRYRSSTKGMIERTVYEAHLHALEEKKRKDAIDDANPDPDRFLSDDETAAILEVEPGRYAGKFETEGDAPSASNDPESFHSNLITPGTPFFQECVQHIEHFIRHKLSHDPKWQHLTIIFSGPDVPGEGEHKLMDFIRKEKYRDDYNPNLRHCIMGQDGDLIMLGLATHEPNLVLLREQVIFEASRRHLLESNATGVDLYIHNANFEWLHMNVLRDYLAYEFETRCILPDNPFDLEATVDDFVFMTFFVGNDFLPHLPALDIADEAFELLFFTYKRLRWKWLEDSSVPPYLSNAGNIVSGSRLEEFLAALGSHESPYHDNKRRDFKHRMTNWRKSDEKFGYKSAIPEDEVMESKEQTDRAKYREMLRSIDPVEVGASIDQYPRFAPVLSGSDLPSFQASPPDEDIEKIMQSRLGNLLQYSVLSNDTAGQHLSFRSLDDNDTKGRYYFDKFGFTPFDAEKHVALRKAYIEGLVWTLKYYYQGVVSWEWYYPYHYGPMLSDVIGIEQMLSDVSFKDRYGEPLRPFEQLMACMPPSSSYMLPGPYRWLLSDPSSPIIDFYPKSFIVDMNGKRWPWEAVVMLPFIDSKRLTLASRALVTDDMLSEDERNRNSHGHALLFTRDDEWTERVPAIGEGEGFGAIDDCKVPRTPFQATRWSFEPNETTVFRPELANGVKIPLPGFASLRTVPTERLLRRRIGLNVFGLRSKYRTAMLEMSDTLPEFPPADAVASKLIGTTVQFNFPFFSEGFVTAVSNSEMTIRGTGGNCVRYHESSKIEQRKQRRSTLVKAHLFGENLTGTGGWKIPPGDITVSVRPFERLRTMPDGNVVKMFAKFEVELPLIAAVWEPLQKDPRLVSVPALLEKDPYRSGEHAKEDVLLANRPAVAAENTPSLYLLPHLPDRPSLIDGSVESSPLLPTIDTEIQDCSPQPIATHTARSLLGSSGSSRGVSTFAYGRRCEWKADSRKRYGTVTPFQMQLVPPTRGRLPLGTSRNMVKNGRSILRPRGLGRGRLLIAGATLLAGASLNGAQSHIFRWRRHCHDRAAAGAFMPNIYFGGGSQTDYSDDIFTPPPPLEFAHGTTTISFAFRDGIIAAVDSRASIGNFVGSKTTQKVLPVNSHVLGTMAGGAADCSYWIRKLKAEAGFHELIEGKRISIVRASRILSNALYDNRSLELSVGTMIMGFDSEGGGPCIYYIDNSGIRMAGDVFAVGSGSTFALAILDTERKPDMSQEEAIALGIKAIRHATFRDAYSGGFIGVYLITSSGWCKVFSEDIARSSLE